MSKQKKIISSSFSSKNKIDYVVTVSLYCWHLWISKASAAMEIRALHIIRKFVSVFLPKRYVYKCYRNQMNNRKYRDLLFRDLECGQNIRTSKDMVYLTIIGYLAFPVSVVFGIISSFIGWDLVLSWKDGMVYFGISLIEIILILIGLSILKKGIDNPKDYISYFKQFKKQDEEWLRKWKRNTILFFIRGLLLLAVSFGFGFLCIAIQRNLL